MTETTQAKWTLDDLTRLVRDTEMPEVVKDVLCAMRIRILNLSGNTIIINGDDIKVGREDQRIGEVSLRMTLEPGSYLWGDLLNGSVAQMFSTIGELTDCNQCRKDAHHAYAIDTAQRHHEEECELVVACPVAEDGRDMLDVIFTRLYAHVNQFHTPIGYYFGTHEGDGADIGVWLDEQGPDVWGRDEADK